MTERNERFETMKTDMASLREVAMKRSEALKNEVTGAATALAESSISMDSREAIFTRFSSVESLAGVAIENIKLLIESLEQIGTRNLPAANGSSVSAKSAITNLKRIIQARA